MTVELIAATASLVGALTSVISALNPPKIHIPDVKLPEQDFAKIEAAIAGNKLLSEEAKIAAQNAIRLYNEGKLTPNYQAKLDEWWEEAKKIVNQRLAAAGLQNSHVAVQAMNELNKKYASLYTDLLRTQLQDALSLAGLSEQYIKDLMNLANMKLQGAQIVQQSALREAELRANIKAQQGKAFANAFTSLGQAVKDIGSAIDALAKQKLSDIPNFTSLGTSDAYTEFMSIKPENISLGAKPYKLEDLFWVSPYTGFVKKDIGSSFVYNPQTGKFESIYGSLSGPLYKYDYGKGQFKVIT